MTKLYAKSFDIHAPCFYFDSTGKYIEKPENNVNNFGQKIEEYEIERIEEGVDQDLFKSLK
jgi:hypothetical protein